MNKKGLTEGEPPPPKKKAQVALTNASLEEVQGDALLLTEHLHTQLTPKASFWIGKHFLIETRTEARPRLCVIDI